VVTTESDGLYNISGTLYMERIVLKAERLTVGPEAKLPRQMMRHFGDNRLAKGIIFQ